MIVESVYFLLPAALANMMPVFVKNYFKILEYPLDFNFKFFDGKRILGAHKTFRGLIFGILGAMIVALIQKNLHTNYIFNAVSLVNYSEINILLFGFLMGFGVIFGDALGSFVKRRFNFKPGESFYLLDQAGSALGIGMFVVPFYSIIFNNYVYIFLFWILGHFFIKFIGYIMKVDDRVV